jgi:hypothetical protein
VAAISPTTGEHLHESSNARVRLGRIAIADESDFHINSCAG